MGVPTLVNQTPTGTLKGSPIKVVNTYSQAGQTSNTTAFPIPSEARAGDLMLVFFGYGATGGNSLFINSFDQSPITFTQTITFQGATGGSQTNAILSYYRIVTANEPGTVIDVRFPGPTFVTWGIVVYCLRYVDSLSPIDGGTGQVGTNHSTSDFLNASTTSCGTTTPNSLIVSALSASSGPAGVGIGHGPLAGWRDTIDAVGGSQPNYGLVSGIIDMPYAAVWQGAGCQWNAGAGSINSDFTAISVPVKATPAPSAPGVTLTPSGGSIDAAGTSGTPLSVAWTFSPVRGQGSQEAWLIARQPNAGGTLQFYNADSNLWQTAEYWNLGPATSFQFPTSAWVNDGTNWDLSVAVRESNLHLKSAVAGPFTFTADAPPSLSSVSVTNPNTATPTVSWAETLTRTPQVGYRVRVFSSDQLALPGFNPANILVGDDSDFELGVGTWTSLNSVASLGATQNYTGGGDLKITANTTAGVSAFSGSYPVTAGVQYYATGYVRADVTPRAMHLGFSWQDYTGAVISTTNGTAVTDSTSGWTLLTVNGTAPTGAVTARLTVGSTVSAVNEVHRLDQAYWSATPVPRWASGMVLSTATSAVTGTLVGGGNYTAYVQVLQTGDQVTPATAVTNGTYVNTPTATWYAGFSAPAQPTLAVVAQNDPGTGAPTNFLTITGHDVGGFAGTGTALVQYSDDQVTWTTLRNAAALPLTTGSGQVATVADFETFQNKIRYYRVQVNNTSSGVAVSSAWSTTQSATATSSPASVWIVAPLNPGVSFAAPVEGIDQVQTEQLATRYALGRPDPIINFDVVNGKDATLTLFTISAAEDAAIDTAIAQQATLWISSPLSEGYYIRLGPAPGGSGSSGGATVKSTKLDPSPLATPVRETTLTYVVVKRP